MLISILVVPIVTLNCKISFTRCIKTIWEPGILQKLCISMWKEQLTGWGDINCNINNIIIKRKTKYKKLGFPQDVVKKTLKMIVTIIQLKLHDAHKKWVELWSYCHLVLFVHRIIAYYSIIQFTEGILTLPTMEHFL